MKYLFAIGMIAFYSGCELPTPEEQERNHKAYFDSRTYVYDTRTDLCFIYIMVNQAAGTTLVPCTEKVIKHSIVIKD